MKDKKWYRDGLKFECTGCGECCRDHGEYTYIYLTQDDIDAAGRYLEMSPADFLAEYCIQKDGLTFLKMTAPQCPFLEDGKCVLYTARPQQCRTWPFWWPNLEKETWDKEVTPFCPGVGNGKHYTMEVIEAIAHNAEEGYEEPLEDPLNNTE